MKKTGRNDPCPCGSGKKFKKCCESKAIAGRFIATKIDSESPVSPSGMTSFFHSHVSLAKPSDSTRQIKASSDTQAPPENKEEPAHPPAPESPEENKPPEDQGKSSE